jgi:Domain of unknown function (DUF4371)
MELKSLNANNASYTSSLFHSEALDAMVKVLRARLVAAAQAQANSVQPLVKPAIHRDLDKVVYHLRFEVDELLQARLLRSLLIDETTSCSNTKELIVYEKFVIDGKPATKFAALITVRSGTADDILAALKKWFKENDVSVEDIVCFGSDGASVMLGRFSTESFSDLTLFTAKTASLLNSKN